MQKVADDHLLGQEQHVNDITTQDQKLFDCNQRKTIWLQSIKHAMNLFLKTDAFETTCEPLFINLESSVYTTPVLGEEFSFSQ